MNIAISEITKKYGSVAALEKVSLEIQAGQIVALVGPNGAGKTTLLRVLAGIIAPKTGEIRYDREVFNRGRVDLRRRFFFLPDFPLIFDHWSTLQHIGMVLKLYEANLSGIEEKVISLLTEFELLPLAEGPLATLSRGQRYKAALAAFIAADPEVWMLDEPFASGMDPQGISAFKRHSREAAARGRTIIYSTQILDAAERFSDRVCIIYRGAVVAYDSVEKLRDESLPKEGVLESIFNLLREQPLP